MKLEIAKIVLDDTLYPRNQVFWLRSYQYAEAIKAGAVMPPLVVGKKDNFYVLLDGRHRLEAYKKLKMAHAPVLISKVKPKEFFAEAVRLNVTHGQGLSVQERLTAADKLKQQGYGDTAISRIVFIPLTQLQRLIADRVIRDPITGARRFTAKKTVLPVKDRLQNGEAQQAAFRGLSQSSLLTEVVLLLTQNLIDYEDAKILGLLRQLQDALAKMDLGAVAVA